MRVILLSAMTDIESVNAALKAGVIACVLRCTKKLQSGQTIYVRYRSEDEQSGKETREASSAGCPVV